MRDVNVHLVEQLSVIEWYDHSLGLREVLVRSAEEEKVRHGV